METLKFVCQRCNTEIPYHTIDYGTIVRDSGEIVAYHICPICRKWDCFNPIEDNPKPFIKENV
jgi:hypothetical protein